MTEEEYVQKEIVSGRLTYQEIAELTGFFQSHHGLLVDRKPGPITQARINELTEARKPTSTAITTQRCLYCPMPMLSDGRKAVVTSSFRHKDRPNHDGVDMFYPWRKGDSPSFIGDGGAAGKSKDGSPKWVVPYETMAVAANEGVVQIAGLTGTGYRVWVDHGLGIRSGYFHLQKLFVSVGQTVSRGLPLGFIGDNPSDNDARHLHFEVSLSDKYAPLDPQKYAIGW